LLINAHSKARSISALNHDLDNNSLWPELGIYRNITSHTQCNASMNASYGMRLYENEPDQFETVSANLYLGGKERKKT
jgi:hypothetical protein